MLAVNLKNVTDVYPYVVTSGREAYEYARSIDDEFIEFWAHQVCEMALTSFRVDALEAVKQQTGFQNLSSMNPGLHRQLAHRSAETAVRPAGQRV